VNGGVSWAFNYVGPVGNYGLNSVSFADSMRGFVCGDFAPYRTTDGGLNWSPVTVQPNTSLNYVRLQYVQLMGSDKGYVAGRYVAQAFGSSGFHTWDYAVAGVVSSDASAEIYAVGNPVLDVKGPVATSLWFTSDTVGYLTLGNGMIQKTTDKAAHWSGKAISSTALNAICFVNNLTGFTVGDSGRIFKTNDAGANWVAQNGGAVRNLRAVRFIDTNIGYAVGDSGTILETTNGGSAWVVRSGITALSLKAIVLVGNGGTGYVVGEGGIILKMTGGTPSAVRGFNLSRHNLGNHQAIDPWYGFTLPDNRVLNVLGRSPVQFAPVPSKQRGSR